ncbi:MAG: MFS transporter, partial [Desulfovibrio sp.]|nr:MFS transporter [Desulfovibrio sp.]
MHRAVLAIFGSARFVGPQKAPRRWDKPDHVPQKLLSREFILLFLMAMCSNSYIAVYYCFEQWMQGLGIAPHWRGILLSSLFAMILIFRPLTSVFMLKRSKLGAMVVSLTVMSLVMLVYPYVTPGDAVSTILCLRLVQGIALAVFSCCTVAVLVDCIPPGQSARGFALFSLTMLLPYSIIPAMSESLIPLLGGEARLFAATTVLGVPSFVMVGLLAKRLRTPEVPPQSGMSRGELWHAIT